MQYMRMPLNVEAQKWGPTWESMKKTARWLGESGIVFQFATLGQQFEEDEEYGLPTLIVYDQRWRQVEVSVGDYLVMAAPHEISVVPSAVFRREYQAVEHESRL